MKWQPIPLALLAIAGLVVGIACSGDDDSSNSNRSPTAYTVDTDFMGVFVTPALPKPDAILTDTSGQPFDLRKETEGFVTLLYVGYTHCPDVCPTHMADIAYVLKELPEDVSSKIKVVLVTADPERDTPEVLRKWLDLFSEDFIGLTGTREQTDAFQQSLSMNPASRTDIGGGNYTVNHAAYVMAYSQDNLAHLVYPLGVTDETWMNDLTILVKEGWKQ
ncbi:MAG: SCO family protein [Dehalococcoidia bacterium]